MKTKAYKAIDQLDGELATVFVRGDEMMVKDYEQGDGETGSCRFIRENSIWQDNNPARFQMIELMWEV